MLALGAGLLIAWAIDRRRFLIPGLNVVGPALAHVLWQLGALPGSALDGAHPLGVGTGLALATVAARRGSVGSNPLSPSLWMLVIGALVLGTSLNSPAAASFYRFFVSLWMPTAIFTLLAVWITVRRTRTPVVG